MANPRKSKTPEHQLHHFSECLGPGEVGFIHDKQSYKSSWLSQWGAGFKWTEFPRVKDQSDVDPWIINIYPAQGGNAERLMEIKNEIGASTFESYRWKKLQDTKGKFWRLKACREQGDNSPLEGGVLARSRPDLEHGYYDYDLSIEAKLEPRVLFACALASVLFYFEDVGRPIMTLSQPRISDTNHVYIRDRTYKTDVYSFIIVRKEDGSVLGIRIGSFGTP